MALPSQMPRTSRQASLRATGGRRRSTSAAALVAALIVAGSLFAWWYTQHDAAPRSDTGAPRPTEAAILPAKEKMTLALGEPKSTINATLERKPLLNQPDPSRIAAPTQTTAIPSKPGPAPAAAQPEVPPPQPSSPPVSEPQPSSAAPTMPSNTAASPGSVAPFRDPAIQLALSSADNSIASGRKAEARTALNRALHDPRASDADEDLLRRRLADLNAEMVFSPTVIPGDPIVDTHTVASGDRLVKIVNAYDLKVDWRFLQRVNAMSDPGRLRIGQKLKIVRGPFHAVISKRAYRLDLYADATDPDGNHLYIRSFAVGLGENNSTPMGKWIVRQSSKLVNPHWVNPRTGEKFGADDPKNPIGEFWLGITGTEAATEVLSGYGIHGTIEPDSIGRDASMGCVRMLPDDIALVYETLVEGYSQVEIRP